MALKNSRYKSFFNKHSHVLVSACLILSIIAVYWPLTQSGFVNYDDGLYVLDNAKVQEGLTLDNIIWAFTTFHASNWHPLTWLSHMLDCRFYGMNPGGHHLTNLFLHILNTLLLFFILRRLTGKLWQSAFVAALFAIHPIHVESVAWIAERKDVLSALFWMLTIWSYILYVESPTYKKYFWIILFFILGLLSKPMLVTLPFVLLLLDFYPLQRFYPRQSDRNMTTRHRLIAFRLVLEKTPLFFLAAISSAVTFCAQQQGGAVKSLAIYPFSDRIANVPVVYAKYIAKMIYPSNLAVLYPYQGSSSWWVIAGACVLLASITFIVIRFIKRCPFLVVGWFWYLGTLVPVIGLVKIGIHSMADRYTYLPFIGLFIILSWGISELAARLRRHGTIWLAALAIAYLAILMAVTWRQVGYWRNSVSLFKHTLEVTDNNYLIHNNLGAVLNKDGNATEAVEHYLDALRIKPDYADAHYNLGIVLKDQGKTAEAQKHFMEAVHSNPEHVKAHNNLGYIFAEQNRLDEAIYHFSEVVRIDPRFAKAHNNLGNALVAKGDREKAVEHYLIALDIEPDSFEVHNNLGAALIRMGKIEEAILHFKEALKLKPNFDAAIENLDKTSAIKAEIDKKIFKAKSLMEREPKNSTLHLKLGELYQLKGEVNAAIDQYQTALAIKPEFPEALHNLAIVYITRAEYDKSLSLLRRILDIAPDHAPTYYNIACIYAVQYKTKESIEWLKKAIKRGYDNWGLIKTDKYLENIRGTSEFIELIRGH